MDNQELKFWAVWRQAGGSTPSKRHEHREDAITEANRLANASGECYYVLEVIGVVKPIPIPYDFTEM